MSGALPPSDKLLAPVPPPRVPDHVSDTAIEPPALTGVPRVVRGLRSRSNWLQLVRFGLVGGSGFIVNTAVYTFCLHVLDLHYLPSAVVAFCVAVTNNFLWNRLWTFSGSGTARAHVQGMRFLAVSVTALAAEPRAAHVVRAARPRQDPCADAGRLPGDADLVRRQQALDVRLTIRRAAIAALVAVALVATPALAADDAPALGQDDPAAQAGLEKQELTRRQAIAKARADERIDDWVSRYDGVTTSAGLDDAGNRWTVHFRVPGKDAGEIAQAVVDAHSGQVLEAWTGPQVAWKMARGYRDAFGHKLNRPAIWLAFCLAFLIVVIDWRRPLRLLNLDLLALIAFSFSLGAFNQGMIFWSVPLAYPPLLYLTGRLGWIGVKGRRQGAWTGRLPVWALAGLAVFLIGFRGGLNAYDSGVIDVGYAGIVGADRILSGTTPYGTIPERTGNGCGPKFRTATTAPTARRAAAASRSPSASTRTGPSTTRPTCRRWPRSAGRAAGTTSPRRT